MIQYNDTARDYIQRQRRANDYLRRMQREKVSNTEKADNRLFGRILIVAVICMAVASVVMIPQALDTFHDKQYEQPMKDHKGMTE